MKNKNNIILMILIIISIISCLLFDLSDMYNNHSVLNIISSNSNCVQEQYVIPNYYYDGKIQQDISISSNSEIWEKYNLTKTNSVEDVAKELDEKGYTQNEINLILDKGSKNSMFFFSNLMSLISYIIANAVNILLLLWFINLAKKVN